MYDLRYVIMYLKPKANGRIPSDVAMLSWLRRHVQDYHVLFTYHLPTLITRASATPHPTSPHRDVTSQPKPIPPNWGPGDGSALADTN